MSIKHDIIIYTDGACIGNPGPGGWGTILVDTSSGEELELSGGLKGTTNNRMELIAVLAGLEAVTDESAKILVVSDSKYVVDSVNKKWVLGWAKKGFKDRKNADLWIMYLGYAKKLDIEFTWVKGHNGHEYNERCDNLAGKASKIKTNERDQRDR